MEGPLTAEAYVPTFSRRSLTCEERASTPIETAPVARSQTKLSALAAKTLVTGDLIRFRGWQAEDFPYLELELRQPGVEPDPEGGLRVLALEASGLLAYEPRLRLGSMNRLVCCSASIKANWRS